SASMPTTPSGAARISSTPPSSSSSASWAVTSTWPMHARTSACTRSKAATSRCSAMASKAVLSMIEAAVELTDARIAATDLHRIVGLGKDLLRHPVELLPGVREAVEAIAADFEVVLITKGDLFHQEAKVRDCGLAGLFRRIEIVSEKDPPTYARLLEEFDLPAHRFVMIGNSLRSDIAPVLALGGWGIHVPYHTTWAHETGVEIAPDEPRVRTVATAGELPAAVAALARAARSGGFRNDC